MARIPEVDPDQASPRVAAVLNAQAKTFAELIAWENASARFNRALGVESQQIWNRTER